MSAFGLTILGEQIGDAIVVYLQERDLEHAILLDEVVVFKGGHDVLQWPRDYAQAVIAGPRCQAVNQGLGYQYLRLAALVLRLQQLVLLPPEDLDLWSWGFDSFALCFCDSTPEISRWAPGFIHLPTRIRLLISKHSVSFTWVRWSIYDNIAVPCLIQE